MTPPVLAKGALSASEREELEEVAIEVAEHVEELSAARHRQTQLWRLLVTAGRSKTQIAEASSVTINAVNTRIAPAPSRVNRSRRARR